ncbi:hypothetical protein G6F70_007928 [Rhizopus microsporus]|uniref:Uncharacterized protein n=2 Tax=Rhizopus TaxID=4842 RepID=A0A367JUA9_RHIAZ|nr:hypothetical protein G6F71_007931 [Rhizopus microsporus]RCH93554.1 hypothetical protein CU097_012315 [Rhizopus azygosporus]KAG1195830.1 hypothetical protein G6F70_007928 [Rhizopus microsporus]KAG1207779.1 hypothetical protein G6F69_007767 [Rhizopus microsporus]KAG1226824.1 hypothetical protein G6F67_008791 [Rhizopus microsporus]
MNINLDLAEIIIQTSDKAKQRIWLHKLVEQVQLRQRCIHIYLRTVLMIEAQYQQKMKDIESYIDRLNQQKERIDHEITHLNDHQQALVQRQTEVEHALALIRREAQRYREKKTRCEHYYSRLCAVPILSKQYKTKYIKARDRNAQTEQHLSEMRHALDLCQNQLKVITKRITEQYMEQDQLYKQKSSSLDSLKRIEKVLHFLKQGSEFWSNFETYQAQVVLEAANYLLKNTRYKVSKKLTVDVDQIWIKTFKLACLEYGERQVYGDNRWNMDTLNISYDCSACQTSHIGWPKISQCQLLCSHCIQRKPVQSVLPVSKSFSIAYLEQFKKIFHFKLLK